MYIPNGMWSTKFGSSRLGDASHAEVVQGGWKWFVSLRYAWFITQVMREKIKISNKHTLAKNKKNKLVKKKITKG